MAATNDHADVGNADLWPALRYDDWKDTCATLQLWTQGGRQGPAQARTDGEPLVAGCALCHRVRADYVDDAVPAQRLPRLGTVVIDFSAYTFSSLLAAMVRVAGMDCAVKSSSELPWMTTSLLPLISGQREKSCGVPPQ